MSVPRRRNASPSPAIRAVFALSPGALPEIFSEEALARIRLRARLSDAVVPSASWRRHTRTLRTAEVIFSGWGAPVMDEAFLSKTPDLRAVFHVAGSVRYCTTPELWRRGIRFSTTHAVGAIPVAEYTVAAVLLGLKCFWKHAREVRALRAFPTELPVTGAYGSRVGLVSYGTVARLVRERLRPFDVRVLVHEPSLSPAEAAREGVEPVDLATLFSACDAVSVHAPLTPETHGLITGKLLRRLPPRATFINTSHGDLVREDELIAVLARRPDLQAVLDACSPEPPARESPLYDLPNVVLTPHISGALGAECLRLGDAMVEEFERFAAGQPLRWELDEAHVASLS